MEQELCTHLPTEHTCWHWSWLNTDSLYYFNDEDAEKNFPSETKVICSENIGKENNENINS